MSKRRPNNPIVEEAQSYAVSAVFTHVDKGGKGYATHMLRLLHWILAPRDALPNFPAEWGAPLNVPPNFGDAMFSFLSSDIGSKFYEDRGPTSEERGWVVGHHCHTVWGNISAASPPDSPNTVTGEWKYLKEDTAKIIWDKDAVLMKKEATDFIKSLTTSRSTAFAILPNKGLAAYFFYRQMRISPDGTIKLPTDTWGIQLIASDAAHPDEPTVFATWLIERQKDPQNLISRLRATPETFPALLAKIYDTAKEEGVNQVEVYNLPKELEAVARELGGVTSSREYSLPMLKWYGLEEEEQVDWLYNEE
ncbi:hypothetical protein K474DRAFT_1711927 [Panus rudis PR-1116 ss-1]|nr:hypothetical protein K474DRAFT_1711927 [Panus rudis PR-1116 ss-1]